MSSDLQTNAITESRKMNENAMLVSAFKIEWVKRDTALKLPIHALTVFSTTETTLKYRLNHYSLILSL